MRKTGPESDKQMTIIKAKQIMSVVFTTELSPPTCPQNQHVHPTMNELATAVYGACANYIKRQLESAFGESSSHVPR